MKRIVIIGTTGTGKTTLASQVANRLGYPHVELDSLFGRLCFSTNQSLILWAFKTHGRHRRQFAELLRKPEHAHLRVVHFQTTRETEEWLMQVKQKTGGSQTRP